MRGSLTSIVAVVIAAGGAVAAIAAESSLSSRFQRLRLAASGAIVAHERPAIAMMRLTRDVCVKMQAFNTKYQCEIALLTADSIRWGNSPVGAPYSLCAHVKYQDSHCRPKANGPAIFPNYRNVVWHCNWWPVRNWHPAAGLVIPRSILHTDPNEQGAGLTTTIHASLPEGHYLSHGPGHGAPGRLLAETGPSAVQACSSSRARNRDGQN